MGGGDPVHVAVQLQVQGIEHVVAGLDLGDEVPAHLVQIALDGPAHLLQRVADPGLERLAPLRDPGAIVRRVALLPLAGHHGIRLEQQEECQAGTPDTERFAFRGPGLRERRRSRVGIGVVLHLACHVGLHPLQQPQRIDAERLEIGRTDQRQ